ncbi:hypothetical protein F4860DRAFT_481117 [Xylaria cubensis]|nr:hypothetical protein F4860DRAFT_481117 [Xylaria cubensis]
MTLTEAYGRVAENINNTITSEPRRTSTTSSQGRNPLPLRETQERAFRRQESDLSSIEPSQPSSITAKPLDQPLPVTESLGRRGLFGVVGGSLWILGIFGFLTFLWFGQGSRPEAADATRLWRFIALHNYFPQTITLCALALRVAVSFQAAACTSMIAAIVLEKHGSQRTQVAWLSVMRSINDGPLKLCGLLVSSKGIAALLRRVEIWLAFLIIIVTSALQFSSTLLLSDINDFTIVGDLNSTQLNDIILYKKEDFAAELLGSQFISQPPVYAAFGETQAGFNATPSASGLSNTGLIQRSLLPIPGSDARSSVRNIEATSVVMTSQSACIRPQISAIYEAELFDLDETDAFGSITGTVDYKRSLESAGVRHSGLCSDTSCEDVAFECPIPSSTAGWQTVICLFDGIVGRGGTIGRSGTDERIGPVSVDPVWDPTDGVWSRNTSVVLVITTNMDYKDWESITDTNNTLPAGNPYQEWQSYQIGTGQYVNISLCSSGFSLGRFDTSMSTPGPLREPQTDLILTSKTYSTTDVQRFLGVSEPQRSHFDRNILDLKVLGTPASDAGLSPASQQAYSRPFGGNITVGRLTTAVMETVMYYQLTPGFQPNMSLSLCFFCTTDGYSVNPEISLLFNDIVTNTGRAANALLSLTTIIFSSVYYTYLSTLRVRHDARIKAITTVPAPGPCSTNGCPGFTSVTTLLFVHVLCVAIITILYVRQIRYSRHGNIWHSISQLTGNGLTDMLKEAQNAGDAEVERIVDKEYKNCKVKVGREQAGGPIEVINV